MFHPHGNNPPTISMNNLASFASFHGLRQQQATPISRNYPIRLIVKSPSNPPQPILSVCVVLFPHSFFFQQWTLNWWQLLLFCVRDSGELNNEGRKERCSNPQKKISNF
jgi:hypothetical protein